MTKNISNYFEDCGDKWIKSSYGKRQTIAKTRISKVLRAVRKINPNSICDIGCGDGRFLKHFPKVNRKLGLDNSSIMLKHCAKTDKTIKTIRINLNKGHSLAKLNSQKPFELVTMLGVLHYLKNPYFTLSFLSRLCKKNGFFILSFRNRLFNLSKNSYYFKSKMTRKTSHHLKEEAAFLDTEKNKIKEINRFWAKKLKLKNIQKTIQKRKSMNGVNDLYWNPYNYEYWRQFTPIECSQLLKTLGFSIMSIIKLSNKRCSFSKCTSCLIIAKKKGS